MSVDSIKDKCEFYLYLPLYACLNSSEFRTEFASADCKTKTLVIAIFASFLTLVIPLFVGITLGICKLLAGRVKQEEGNLSNLNADNITQIAAKPLHVEV